MINWKELEKFITPGKICTLVIMIDGKEIGAFSFNIETLAYKEILETVTKEPVTIAEKAKEEAVMPSNKVYLADKKAEAAAEAKKAKDKKIADKNDKTKVHPEFNPIPATADKPKEILVNEETGEIKEEKSPTQEEIEEYEDSQQPENIAERYHPSAKTIEPVSAATLDDDEPEVKPEIPKEDVKNEKIQEQDETGSREINFDEEKW